MRIVHGVVVVVAITADGIVVGAGRVVVVVGAMVVSELTGATDVVDTTRLAVDSGGGTDCTGGSEGDAGTDGTVVAVFPALELSAVGRSRRPSPSANG